MEPFGGVAPRSKTQEVPSLCDPLNTESGSKLDQLLGFDAYEQPDFSAAKAAEVFKCVCFKF